MNFVLCVVFCVCVCDSALNCNDKNDKIGMEKETNFQVSVIKYLTNYFFRAELRVACFPFQIFK